MGADTGLASSVDTNSGPFYGLILMSLKYIDRRSDVAANGQGCYVCESEYTNKKSIRMISLNIIISNKNGVCHTSAIMQDAYLKLQKLGGLKFGTQIAIH